METLTTLEAGEMAHRWPHILPGGRAVLFTVVKGQRQENMEIAALNLDTGERTLLVPGGSNPHYAPTGHLVYGVDGTLRAVPFDPDRLEVTGDPVPVLEGVITHPLGAAHFSVAADGSLVYLSGGGSAFSESTLVWVDRQGNEIYARPPGSAELRHPTSVPRQGPSGSDAGDFWGRELRRVGVRSGVGDAETGASATKCWSPAGNPSAC